MTAIADTVRYYMAKGWPVFPVNGKVPARLARLPGRLPLSVGLGGILESVPSLDAVLVDGEPLASPAPDRKVERYRVAKPPPPPPRIYSGGLLPGPRTLDGRATAGLLVEAAAGTALTGDERSPHGRARGGGRVRPTPRDTSLNPKKKQAGTEGPDSAVCPSVHLGGSLASLPVGWKKERGTGETVKCVRGDPRAVHGRNIVRPGHPSR